MANRVEVEFVATVDDAIRGIDKVENSLEGVTDAANKTGQSTDKASFSFTELNSALSLAGKGLELLDKAYEATVTPTLELAASQRELALAGQITAEEAGRLIQVSDDLGIEVSALKAAFREMAKDGIQPSIANIKQIAKEYQAAGSPTEALKIAQDGLGRSYQTLLPLLEQTPEAIDAMAMSAERGGLVMSEDAVQAARDYELALDGLNDRIEAVKVSIGTALIPALVEAVDSMNNQATAVSLFQQAMDEGLLTQEEWVRISHELKFNTGDLAATIDLLNTKLSENSGFAGEATGGLNTYEIAGKNAAQSQRDLAAAIDETNTRGDPSAQVFKDAEKALREFNIGMATRIELEEQLALASGKITQEDLMRQEQVGFLTKQLELGNITQQEWIEGVNALADGATNVSDAIGEKLVPAIEATGDALEDKFLTQALKVDREFKETMPASIGTTIKSTNLYGEALAEQSKSGGSIYTYLIGLHQIDAAFKNIAASASKIPSLPGVTSGGAGGGGAVRDSGGPGLAGHLYTIGTGAQPEGFIPNTNGTFVPNIDKLGGGDLTLIINLDGQGVYESVIREGKARGQIVVQAA